MKYSVIFDMDGVLIDSELAMRVSAQEALKEYGVNAPAEDFDEFTGMGENRFVGGVAEKHGVPFRTEMKDRAYELYGTTIKNLIVVYEGIAELIRSLKAEGRKIAVASAADRVKVLINLDCIGVTAADFNAVITGSVVSKNKPDPEIYLTAAAAIGADPATCIVNEDTPAGIRAAKAAGMLCVGITSTYSEEILRANGADYILPHTSGLLQLLHQIQK